MKLKKKTFLYIDFLWIFDFCYFYSKPIILVGLFNINFLKKYFLYFMINNILSSCVTVWKGNNIMLLILKNEKDEKDFMQNMSFISY